VVEQFCRGVTAMKRRDRQWAMSRRAKQACVNNDVSGGRTNGRAVRAQTLINLLIDWRQRGRTMVR